MSSSVLLTVYLPLLGLEFDHLEFAALDAKAGFGKPSLEEWRFVCKTGVWLKEIKNSANLMFDEQAVPACIQLFSQIEPGQDLGPLLYRDFRAGWDSVLILRLFKPGWFFSPHLFQICYSTTEGHYGREPGPYRQIQKKHFGDFDSQHYCLDLSELVTGNIQASAPISPTSRLVRQYRDTGTDSSVEYAARNFHLSYSLFVCWAQRCSHLFTALDTMLGGMSATTIYDTPLKTRFKERVLLLLQNAALNDAETETRWLDDHLAGGRYIRNNIAHGNLEAVEESSRQSYARLQRLARVILKQYIRHPTSSHILAMLLDRHPCLLAL